MRLIWIVAAAMLLSGCDLDPNVRDAKQAVLRQLKDPDSARFRDVHPCAQKGAIEGEVNSKNSYGGYAGFEPFIYADGQVAVGFGADNFDALQRRCYPLDIVANMSNAADITDDMTGGIDNVQ